MLRNLQFATHTSSDRVDRPVSPRYTRSAGFSHSTGFSINGWLAVLLTFVLARVFAEGALMRDDLQETV